MKETYLALGPQGFGSYDIVWDGETPQYTPVQKAPKKLLIPGFVDLHIHGAFGIDLMSASKQDIFHLCSKLQAKGYEAFLPTTVSATCKDVLKAIDRLPEHPMIAGFHLEGPFISPAYPGAQPQKAIETPPLPGSEWDEVFDHPNLKIATLAPELPHALDLSIRLMKRQVIASMGHTNATYEEARRGFEFGFSHTTHTYNAMRGLHHREAGVLGYALLNDALKAELIYDRHHVSPEAARVLLKCKTDDNVIAVSDSTMATGLPPGTHLKMWGLDCVKDADSIRLQDGTLAGSCITLLDAFRNLEEDFGTFTALKLCSLNPRKALGMTSPPRVLLEMDANREILQVRLRSTDVVLS